jgi:hypothetical protein
MLKRNGIVHGERMIAVDGKLETLVEKVRVPAAPTLQAADRQ